MLSRCYSAALPILARDVLDVDPKSTALTARDYQLYCLYGGMIHTGTAVFTSPAWVHAKTAGCMGNVKDPTKIMHA